MRYIHITFILLVITVVPGLFPVSVRAHTTGASLYATTSPYVIDLGYDPAVAIEGESMRFDFVLANEKTGDSVSFAQVWVRIKDEKQTLLATGIFRQPFGPTTLLYVFPEAGTYTIQPSYRDKDGNELAAASFQIAVQSLQKSSTYDEILFNGGLLLVGMAFGTVLTMRFIRRTVASENA